MADNREILNLQEPRESDIYGLSDALAKGVELSSNLRRTRAYEKEVEGNAATREIQRADLLYKIHKLDIDSKSTEEKNTLGLLEKIGQYFGSEEKAGEFDNWLTSEGGKAFTKRLKSTLPEMIDPTGKPILIKPETQMKYQLESMKADLLGKVQQGNATEDEKLVAQMLTRFEPNALVNIVKTLVSDPFFQMLPAEEKSKRLAETIQSLEKQGVTKPQSKQSPLSSTLNKSNDDLDSFLGRY